MFGSFILDVAIGMVFIYLLLSLVASGVNEILASIVQSRAANLVRGLRSLLSGDSIEAGALTLVDNVYDHGLVRGLYPDPLKDLNDDSALGWSVKLRLWLQKLVGIAPATPIAGVKNQLLLPSYIPARTFALALIDILNKDKFNGKTAIQNIEDFLSSHHQQFAKNKAVEALLTLLIDAQNDAQEGRGEAAEAPDKPGELVQRRDGSRFGLVQAIHAARSTDCRSGAGDCLQCEFDKHCPSAVGGPRCARRHGERGDGLSERPPESTGGERPTGTTDNRESACRAHGVVGGCCE